MTLDFVIIKRTQHFLVKELSYEASEAIKDFARTLIHYGLIRQHGKFRRAPLKVFAASPFDRSEYRFHINHYNDFLIWAGSKGFNEKRFKVIEELPPEGANVTFSIKKDWVPRENQEPAIDYILDEEGSSQKLLGLQTGFGKAQPKDTKILTPKGFVRLDSLTRGSKIINAHGKIDTVEAIYEQGVLDTYRLVFDDGRSTRSCLNHLWRVYSENDPYKWQVRSLEDILDKGLNMDEYSLFKLYEPCEGLAARHLDQDPYEVGKSLVEIDRAYLEGNLDQRLELVRGILDDLEVVVGEEGLVVNCLIEEFSLFLQELVWSLGGWCKVLDDPNQVLIRHPNPETLFKLKTLPDLSSARSDVMRLRAVLEEEPTLSACIKVRDESELYVADDYVATHNTFISIYSLAKLGKRSLYLMRPMYMDKWLLDFDKIYSEGAENTLMVRGGDQLKSLFMMAKEGTLEAANIVISNRTYQSYLSQYEKYGENLRDMGWDLLPDEVWTTLDIGACVIDEVHQDFHLNFKFALYMNVKLLVAMSATFMSDDSFILRMQEVFCPSNLRFEGGAYNRYVSASSYAFQLSEPKRVRTTEWGDTRYSHHVFERSIMANAKMRENYYRMISRLLKVDYIDIKDPGETAIIFCASIKMCTQLSEYLSKQYPNLKVKRYVEGDDYEENFIDSDVVVTTVGKSGAAVDKPGLRTNIRAVAIRSTTSIYQVFGRTRELKSGNTPRFIYLVCTDIPRQVDYHNHMIKILQDTALDYRHRMHDEII